MACLKTDDRTCQSWFLTCRCRNSYTPILRFPGHCMVYWRIRILFLVAALLNVHPYSNFPTVYGHVNVSYGVRVNRETEFLFTCHLVLNLTRIFFTEKRMSTRVKSCSVVPPSLVSALGPARQWCHRQQSNSVVRSVRDSHQRWS